MEAIEARATLRFERISPQKTRLIADMVRGRNVEEAKKILRFTQRRGAEVMLKLLNSAVANAEVKNVEDPEILLIHEVWVDQGPVHRRYRPRARGRADTWRRPTSHLTIVVKEDVKAKEEEAARRAAIEAKKAKKLLAKKKGAEAKEPTVKKKPVAKKSTAEKKSSDTDKGKE